ncbi:hypothetical protein BV898_08614 [Hypsibius exemplaris]|uniref:Apple domain-containing protein n=1 Tax=Hypsibius exemplaris TaxID=2072580 RepID=A0A1W0WPS6_HYPEX|nr:hypothetical protein BV898_08614 [Hypsibius exemplaris]
MLVKSNGDCRSSVIPLGSGFVNGLLLVSGPVAQRTSSMAEIVTIMATLTRLSPSPLPEMTSINIDQVSTNNGQVVEINFNTGGKVKVIPTKEEAEGDSRVNGIDWMGNWAFSCDFINNDLSRARVVRGEECAALCSNTKGCSHFTWNPAIYGGSYCFMKSGPVSKANAIKLTGHPNVRCGLAECCPRSFNYCGYNLRSVSGGACKNLWTDGLYECVAGQAPRFLYSCDRVCIDGGSGHNDHC